MKRYELKLADGGIGVFKVSIVKDPAIEQTLVHFSSEKQERHFFTDQEKKVIYSVVMRPNLDIFRKNINGEPANVFYTTETVEKAQINYFRNNGNAATNINHSELADAEGIFPFESWIVSDSKTDRAVSFGLDVQDGDWVMGLKVDNDELWEEHIKTGKLDGFSVEAININYELKEDTKMGKDKKKSAWSKLMKFVNENKAIFDEEIAEVSKWWQTVTNTSFELGETVMRKAYEEGGDDYAASAGEFELEDGSRILTDSEGVIRFKFAAAPDPDAIDPDETDEEKMKREKSVKMAEEKAEEDEKEKKAKEAKAAEDAANDDDDDDDDDETDEEALKAEIVELKATIATLRADKVKDDEDLEKMKKQIVKMKKEKPAAGSIPNLPNPENFKDEKPYEKMNNREKMKFNRENKTF
jgi:hypothetical protein